MREYLFIVGCAASSLLGRDFHLVVASGDYSLVMVQQLLVTAASLFAEHGL